MELLVKHARMTCMTFPKAGARFSNVPETFRARKAISKNEEVHTPETSCLKGPLFILRVFCYGFKGPKRFWGLRETSSCPLETACLQSVGLRHKLMSKIN